MDMNRKYKDFQNDIIEKIKTSGEDEDLTNELQILSKNSLSSESKELSFLRRTTNKFRNDSINVASRNERIESGTKAAEMHSKEYAERSSSVTYKFDFSSNVDKASPFAPKIIYSSKNDKIRKSYITKLITCKKWEPSKKKMNHNSLIIYDWDDTLLPTTFLTPLGTLTNNFDLEEREKVTIKKLEEEVHNLLLSSIKRGNTYIITNAAPGWVEFSCRMYYPSVLNLLKNISVISARGEYEKSFPGNNSLWKVKAFLELKKKFNKNLVTNFICMGDNDYEINAANILAAQFDSIVTKTIKFQAIPKPDELLKEVKLVNDKFPYIYNSASNISVCLEKREKFI